MVNTPWAIGIVVYTGKQTKLMMNQGNAKFKQSHIEKQINKLVILLVIVELCMCIVMAVLGGRFTQLKGMFNSSKNSNLAEYLFFSGTNSTSTSLLDSPSSDSSDSDVSATLTNSILASSGSI